MEKDIKFCASILDRVKQEYNKRDSLYENGVDLSNYQNGLYDTTMDSIYYILVGDDIANREILKDYIEWWLFESVEKIIYRTNNRDYNVEKSYDLLKWVLVDRK